MADCANVELREGKNFCCQRCGFVLGKSQTAKLVPAGSDVTVSVRGGERVRLTCPECGASRLWQAMGQG